MRLGSGEWGTNFLLLKKKSHVPFILERGSFIFCVLFMIRFSVMNLNEVLINKY